MFPQKVVIILLFTMETFTSLTIERTCCWQGLGFLRVQSEYVYPVIKQWEWPVRKYLSFQLLQFLHSSLLLQSLHLSKITALKNSNLTRIADNNNCLVGNSTMRYSYAMHHDGNSNRWMPRREQTVLQKRVGTALKHTEQLYFFQQGKNPWLYLRPNAKGIN